MKRIKLGKDKYKMYNLKNKRASGNGMELSSMFKEINRLLESLRLNGIKRVVTSSQDPTELSYKLMRKN